jgi:hypothetical protein
MTYAAQIKKHVARLGIAGAGFWGARKPQKQKETK